MSARLRLLVSAFVVTSVCTFSTSVGASPLFELVGSGFGSGGLNSRATGASAASAYFNPALLPQAKQVSMAPSAVKWCQSCPSV